MKSESVQITRNENSANEFALPLDVLASRMAQTRENLRNLSEQVATSTTTVIDQSARTGKQVNAYARENPGNIAALAAGFIVAIMERRA